MSNATTTFCKVPIAQLQQSWATYVREPCRLGLTFLQCIFNWASDVCVGANSDGERKGKAAMREMKPVSDKAEGQRGQGEFHTWTGGGKERKQPRAVEDLQCAHDHLTPLCW